MSTIAGIKLADSEIALLSGLIDGLPDAFLAKEGPKLFNGGFRNPAALRAHLKNLAGGRNSVPPVVVDLLRGKLPLRDLVDGIKSVRLKELLQGLAGVHGRDTVRLVLLTSESKEIQQLVSEVPANPSKDRKASERELLGRIHRLLDLDPLEAGSAASPVSPDDGIAPADGGAPAGKVASPSLKEENTREAALIEEKEKEIAALKAAVVAAEKESKARRENKLRTAIAELKNRNAELESALAAKEMALKASNARERDLLERIAYLARTEDERVAAQVEQRLRDVEYTWLHPALDLEKELTRPNGDLLERADAILDAQTKLDRQSGNRRHLEQRLNALVDRRSRMVLALKEAVTPHSKIASLIPELDQEIERLRQKLTGATAAGPDASPILTELLSRIRTATTPDGISKARNLVATLATESLLTTAEVADLNAACNNALNRLKAADRTKKALADPRTLTDLIRSNLKSLLLIDGYNVIHKLAEADPSWVVNGKPALGAARRLAECLVTSLKANPGCEARIYFDGPEAGGFLVAPNVRGVFSGGKGTERHRADKAMTGMAQHQAQSGNATRLYFVTEDQDLARRITAAHQPAIPIPSRDLIRTLHP